MSSTVTLEEYWLITIASLFVFLKVKPETKIEPAIPSPAPMVMVPPLIMPPFSPPVMLILEPEEITISLLFKVPMIKL